MNVAQEVYNVTTTTSATSVSQAINGTAANSVLIASVCMNGASLPFITPTDTLGLTWNAGPSTTCASPNRAFQLWWAANPTGGNTTVTGKWTSATQQYGMFVAELDGVRALLDGSSSNSQASAAVGSNTILSGSASNSHAPALMYSITWVDLINATAVQAGTGFTQLSNALGSSGQLVGVFTSEYAALASAGSQQATFTNAGTEAQPAITLMVMFDQAAPPSYYLGNDNYF